MQKTSLQNEIKALGVAADSGVPLAQLCTFNTGGPASVLAHPENVAQLKAVLALCKEKGVKTFILGKGSNLLFVETGFDGVVIQLCGELARVEKADGNTIVCGAGASLAEVCKNAATWGLGGMEFAFGIPGTVGGAVFMNAGAYGGEMQHVVKTVSYLSEIGEEITIDGAECEFAYRHSLFQRQSGCILGCTLQLEKANSADIQNKMSEIMKKRADKQPLSLPSMGSAFKRPVGAYAAALIEECGLKGYQIGGAAVSEKHAGFIVNLGGATASDVIALAQHISKTVFDKTGYTLEKEFQIVE